MVRQDPRRPPRRPQGLADRHLDLAARPGRYTWDAVTPADDDYMPPDKRLLHVLADRARWQAALAEARRRAQDPGGNLSATGGQHHDRR